MVVANRVDQRTSRLSRRPPHRQPAADRLRRLGVRTDLQRHAVGLPGVLAPLREIVSGAVGRLRDRNRAHNSCARTGSRGRRRSTRPITRGRKARPPSSTPGATAFASLRTIIRIYRAERPLPFFTAIGLALAIMSVGFAIPIYRDICGNRPGAAAADRGAVDRPDAAGVSVDGRRTGARYRDARAARDEAACLSVAPGAGRGTTRRS